MIIVALLLCIGLVCYFFNKRKRNTGLKKIPVDENLSEDVGDQEVDNPEVVDPEEIEYFDNCTKEIVTSL